MLEQLLLNPLAFKFATAAFEAALAEAVALLKTSAGEEELRKRIEGKRAMKAKLIDQLKAAMAEEEDVV